MGNCSYISSHKKLTHDIVLALSQKIIVGLFDRHMKLYESGSKSFVVAEASEPIIEADGYPRHCSFEFLISKTSHKLEFANPHRTFDWWVFHRFQNAMALALDGVISDEGIQEKHKGGPDKYPAFMDYLTSYYGSWSWQLNNRIQQVAVKQIIEMELEDAPEWAR